MATGRPKLESGKRTHKIDVRFTEDEYKVITDMEITLGVSKTELLRRRLLNNGNATVINAKELINSLDSIFAEMGRVGNNINQLAKYANTLNLQGALSPLVADKFNDLFQKYLAIEHQLDVTLRKVIRLVGTT